MNPPPLRWRLLSAPKRGHKLDEYEDAAVGDGGRGRFAVADGATESAFAGDWARILTETFVREPAFERPWSDWLPGPRGRWIEAVGGRELPWYLEEKFHQGAFATLLGLEVTAAPPGWEWRAVAIGDCCLFHVRGAELVCTFPMESSTDFNTTPALLSSRPGSPAPDQRARGRARAGDRFLLASDALAQWALRRHEERRGAWAELLELDEARFPAWIDGLWTSKELRVDDVTLLIVELPAAGGDA